ncbi:group 1 glycosyl transferase [Candidatus Magnetomorum sp. HK-1]|nr:group 1 glycosyl transferase [Candidatus Magnetomorum sp. HK-1]
MKILILTTSFPLSKSSTSGVFILHLIENLPESIDMTVLAPCHRTEIKPVAKSKYKLKCFRYAPKSWQILAHEPGGIPVALKNNRKLFFVLPFFLISMTIECLRLARKVDVIHANWSVNGVIAGICAFLTGTPVITTLRGSDVRRSLYSRVEKCLLNLCLKLNDKVIAVSEAICKDVKQNHPGCSQHLLTIPNGVGNNFLNIFPKRDEKKDRSLSFVSIGNLIPQKGISTVLYALKKIAPLDDIKYHIIGDGPEKQNLISLSLKLGISEQVHFLGSISHDEIPGYLANMDVLILSSWGEGRPNVILESMAAGIPVIASNIDGVRELIKDSETGLLFDVDNSGQLAKHMELLKNNPQLRNKLGTAGRQIIFQNGLTWNKTAMRYVQIYKDVFNLN